MTVNIDIISIDKEIKKDFETKIKSVEVLNKKINELKNIITNSPRIKTLVNNDIKRMSDEISDIQDNNSQQIYISESTPIVEEYKKRLNEPIQIDFMNNVVKERDNTDIINKYINIAKKYKKIIPEYPSPTIQQVDKCTNCGGTSFDIVDDNMHTCTSCGNCKKYSIQTNISNRVNVSLKYTYERISHFINCINKYQAKQNTYIKPEVYTSLENYFDMNGLLIGDKSTPKEQRFKKITKSDILHGLKETGNNKYYDDVYLIHTVLTGVPPNDISHVEQKILKDFEILSNLYDEMYKNKLDRSSFLNSKHILCQLLKKYKCKCDELEFQLLKTYERRMFYDDMCRALFNNLGWNFESIF